MTPRLLGAFSFLLNPLASHCGAFSHLENV